MRLTNFIYFTRKVVEQVKAIFVPYLLFLAFLFSFLSKDMVPFQTLWDPSVTKEFDVIRSLTVKWEVFLGFGHCKHMGMDSKCLKFPALTSGKDSSNQQLNQIPQISNSQAFSLRPLYTLKNHLESPKSFYLYRMYLL